MSENQSEQTLPVDVVSGRTILNQFAESPHLSGSGIDQSVWGGHLDEAELRKPVSCNEGIAAVLADSSVEGDRCIAVPAATRAIVTRAEIIWRFMGSLRSAPTIS
jgi:hypothetical protein